MSNRQTRTPFQVNTDNAECGEAAGEQDAQEPMSAGEIKDVLERL